MSPSAAAVRYRQSSLALDAAKKRGDIAEIQRLLGALTALIQTQFGSPKPDLNSERGSCACK